jgi:hypothetical protein
LGEWRVLNQRALCVDLCRAVLFNRAYGDWGLDRAHRHARGATRHQLEEVGVFDRLATTAFASARGPEAIHAVADEGEEALARRLPVVADVDGGVELSLDYCGSSPLDGVLELGFVKSLLGCVARASRLATVAWEAASVGGEDFSSQGWSRWIVSLDRERLLSLLCGMIIGSDL